MMRRVELVFDTGCPLCEETTEKVRRRGGVGEPG